LRGFDCIYVEHRGSEYEGSRRASGYVLLAPTLLGTHTPRITTSNLEPLLCAEGQFPLHLGARLLAMDEVAEAGADAALAGIEAAAGLADVGDGAELAVDGAASVPARVERVRRLLRAVLVLEPRVHVADQVVIVVVAHHQLLQLAVVAQLAPDVLVKGVEVVLQLRRIHLVLSVKAWVVVEIREENCLRIRRFYMLPRAAVTVAARSDFVVEAAIDLVLFGTEDGSEVVGHVDRIVSPFL